MLNLINSKYKYSKKERESMDKEQHAINIGKALIMDTVRNADSGHTGGPLSSIDFT